ncbi:splicing factor 3b subunit 10, putative [Eimeria maxima]|uniref:Splicing factor 3b subunit 10, putative n=1 Tax=Eimeria maxima TaxID=5804 RepID=U6MAW4_EIMMA|nr:splicing factor 3b subunit 10, putative [Eimeria maxima]CDJ61362.1 splicing factor 3b subunit 10, putative [Eimeria maxima]
MSNMDRFTINSQLQHLQSKYPGTGNADTTKLDWGTNIQRDTLASHVGHYSRLAYFAVAENECIKRIRLRCLAQMIHPTAVLPSDSAAAAAGETDKEAAAAASKETIEEEEETKEEQQQQQQQQQQQDDDDKDMDMEGDDV